MFQSARIKLTAWYLLILMAISLAFSIVIYHGLTNEVDRFSRIQRSRFERRLQLNPIFPQDPSIRRFQLFLTDPDLVEDIKRRIIVMLSIINGTIFLAAGGLAYILAGKTLRPIREIVDEQNRFISDASHELRTPLTSLKTSLEVSLRDKNLELKQAKSLISESIEEVNRLQRLSEGLLQLTQYQQPNPKLKLEKLSVRKIIEEAVRKIGPLAKNKSIKIRYKSREFEIRGNKFSLIDLMIILLDNSIKYGNKNSTVVIDTAKEENRISISVKDKGGGISEKDLPYIFNRFYRADSARSKSFQGGYGLGLSIAKKIVEIHGGTIEAKSKIKEGTTIIVKLPIT